jgi:predicted nucleic acid-binding protein
MATEGAVINLSYDDKTLVEPIAKIRTSYRLKLPDAILAATAQTNNCTLVTNDKVFQKVPAQPIINFSL